MTALVVTKNNVEDIEVSLYKTINISCTCNNF